MISTKPPRVDVRTPTIGAVSASVGSRRSRASLLLGAVRTSLFAAVVAGGLGVVLVPMGLTLPWLGVLCGLVFLAWLVIGVRRRAARRQVALREPWATRRHTLDEVAAIQVWCDCGEVRDPHRAGMEVVLHNGSTMRVQPGEAFAPDVAGSLRELLEPFGVKVVDWGVADGS